MEQTVKAFRTKRSDWAFAVTSLAMAATCCSRSCAVGAQAADPLPLLLSPPSVTEVARATVKARSAERSVARHRPVTINFEHLDPRSGRAPARIGVELFDGRLETLDLVRIEQRGGGNFTWHGRVRGYDKSEAVLTVVDGMIAGTISLVDSGARIAANYQLLSNRDGSQSLHEIDPGGFPHDHPEGSESLQAPGRSKALTLGTGRADGTGGGADIANTLDAAADTGAIVDVMVVYSKQTAAAAGTAIGAQIQQAIDVANAAYANSGISIRLNLVYSGVVNYDESGDFNTDLNRLTSTGDGHMDEVATLRNTYGADLVSLFVENGRVLRSRLGRPQRELRLQRGPTGLRLGNLSFVHELGHNFGARHDPHVDASNSPYAYGHGHAVPAAKWRTVMAYNNVSPRQGRAAPASATLESEPHLRQPAAADGNRVDVRQRARAQSECSHGRELPHVGRCGMRVRAFAHQCQCHRYRRERCDQCHRRQRLHMEHHEQRALAHRRRRFGQQRQRHAQLCGCGQHWGGAQRHAHRWRHHLHGEPGLGLQLCAGLDQWQRRRGRWQRRGHADAGAGCTWTASSSASWLTVSSATSGSGTATVTFAAAANTGSQRSANLTIGGVTFIVNQASGCAMRWARPVAASARPVAAAGSR